MGDAILVAHSCHLRQHRSNRISSADRARGRTLGGPI